MGFSIPTGAGIGGVVLVVLLVLALLPGCAILQPSAAARLAVHYATAKMLENSREPATKALRIRAMIHEALAITDSHEQVSVAMVEQAVRARIDWDSLSAADHMAADTLIVALRTELEARCGGGLLDLDDMVPVRDVLNWVLEAVANAVPVAS